MKRRAALQRTALIMGGIISAPTMIALLSGCKSDPKTSTSSKFTADDQTLISELSEVIIPTTDTPGAKEAGVGAFITMMLNDCYSEAQRVNFNAGLEEVENEAKKLGSSFGALSADDKIKVVKIMSTKKMETISVPGEKIMDPETGAEKIAVSQPVVPFFRILKELTTFGYFSSEVGQTMALNHIPIPGRYDACTDLEADQKAFAI